MIKDIVIFILLSPLYWMLNSIGKLANKLAEKIKVMY